MWSILTNYYTSEETSFEVYLQGGTERWTKTNQFPLLLRREVQHSNSECKNRIFIHVLNRSRSKSTMSSPVYNEVQVGPNEFNNVHPTL